MKAIFLDRDGVLIEETHYLHDKNDIKILDNVPKALKLLKEHNYKLIVISNQPVIALGLATEEQVKSINEEINSQIHKHSGVKIDNFYFCPHHPIKGVIKKYKKECNCRKPKPGLIIKAAKDQNIEIKDSYMIGDTRSDILAGKNAGCKTILVKTGHAGTDYEHTVNPDHEVKNLYEAAKLIIRG